MVTGSSRDQKIISFFFNEGVSIQVDIFTFDLLLIKRKESKANDIFYLCLKN